MEGDVIYMDGVGPIGQYYSYLDTFWAKGIAYFLRKCYSEELESLLEVGGETKQVRQLVERINHLNKRISEFEANRELFLNRERQANHGLNKG